MRPPARCPPRTACPSIYDALIIAAALEAGCAALLSEDLQLGRRFGTLTIQNPFADLG